MSKYITEGRVERLYMLKERKRIDLYDYGFAGNIRHLPRNTMRRLYEEGHG